MRTPVELPKAHRLLNHGPTTLVAAEHSGRRNVMAAAWVMPLDFDPPKFAASSKHVERAARSYKDINLLGAKLLAPGGHILTWSCSGAVDAGLFQSIVAGAALDAKRDLRIVHRLGQSFDHPVLLSFPESEYLKGLHLRAD